jgi:hypothetical protein
LLPTESAPLRILLAEVGAGKSLLGERAFQAAVRQRRDDEQAPIPAWLRARDLTGGVEDAVVSATAPLGDAYENSVFVVVDGADEPGLGRAAEVLQQCRELVRVLRGSRVLLTTRPLPVYHGASEACTVPMLEEAEAAEIIARVAGYDITPGGMAGFPESVRDAVRRPLFAVLLGAYLRRHDPGQVPATAELLRELVTNALAGASSDHHGLLRRLAVLATASESGHVPRGEAGPLETAEALSETRLVVLDEREIRFPLILLAHWFAAESLALGETSLEAIVTQPRELELWRYPLALVVGAFGGQAADRVMAALVERHAGFASQIVEEALARWGEMREFVPERPGERVRLAMGSWLQGIGPLAPVVGPVTDRGELLPLGVHLDGDFLTTAWDVRAEVEAPVSALPGSAWDFFGGAVAPAAGPRWARIRGGRVGHQAAWPWRWSFEELKTELSNLLTARRLDLSTGPLAEAHYWMVAKAVLGLGFLHREPVPMSLLLERLHEARGVLVTSRLAIDADVASAKLQRLMDERGITQLRPVLEAPREDYTGGWAWDAWTSEGHIHRAADAYRLAVAAYEALLQGPFSALRPWMQTAATLPARVNVRVSFSDRPDFRGAPLEHVWLEPLPEGAVSEVDVDFAHGGRDWDQDEWRRRLAQLRNLRPRQARWIGLVHHHGVLDLDDDAAAEEIVYKWIWDDLKRISWVDGLLGGRPTGRNLLV